MLNLYKHVDGGFSWHSRKDWLVPINHERRPIRQGGKIKKELSDVCNLLDKALKRKRTCIQAGGNIGIWPIRFSKMFDRVITFEPEPINYFCLAYNTKDIDNIEIINAALSTYSQVDLLNREENNCETFYTVPGTTIKTARIDDYNLKDVDLIYLDIEGAESEAINGARKTIERNWPLIGIEIIFDNPIDDLQSLGYEIMAMVGNDVIMEKS